MYTWEIEKFLAEKNRIVTREEFLKIINQVDNPQITDVSPKGKKYGEFVIKTADGKNMEIIVEMK
jgi:hypothetical protein